MKTSYHPPPTKNLGNPNTQSTQHSLTSTSSALTVQAICMWTQLWQLAVTTHRTEHKKWQPGYCPQQVIYNYTILLQNGNVISVNCIHYTILLQNGNVIVNCIHYTILLQNGNVISVKMCMHTLQWHPTTSTEWRTVYSKNGLGR